MHKTIDREMAAIVGEMAAFDRDLTGVDGEMAAFDRDLAYTKKMAKSRLRIISCFFLDKLWFHSVWAPVGLKASHFFDPGVAMASKLPPGSLLGP